MSKAVFYHIGCPVCVNAEELIVGLLDRPRCDPEVVNIGLDRTRIAEAESAGIKSVPALVIDGNVFHINFGASIEGIKDR